MPLSLPDFLLSGGTEEEWARLAAADAQMLPAIVDEAHDDEDEEGAVIVEQPPSDRDDDDDDDEKEEGANSTAGLVRDSDTATAGGGANTTALLDDDDLLTSRPIDGAAGTSAGGAGGSDDLVEFEIVIDGEVVGSTFLPRRETADGAADAAPNAEQARIAKANALKQQRKRKFDARMGVGEVTGAAAAAAAAAAADSILPQPVALCHSCQKEQVKYKCPKCDLGSCSLACVTEHKTRYNCTGVRSRSAYLPLSRMDERTLANDISFLTDVERMSGASRRDPIMQDKKGETILLPVTQPAAAAAAESESDPSAASANAASLEPSSASLFSCTPRHLDSTAYTLMTACTHHRNTKLMLMPHGMKQRRENASRVYARKNARNTSTANNTNTITTTSSIASLAPSASVIRWTVHLIFKSRALTANGPDSDLKIVKKRVDERLTWAQVLDSVMKPSPMNPSANNDTTAAVDASAPEATKKAVAKVAAEADEPSLANTSTALLRHQLAAFYPEATSTTTTTTTGVDVATDATDPYSHLHLLYPVPFQPSNAPRFYSLRLSSTLLASLAFKVLVEHPIVWIVCARDLHQYTLEKEPVPPTRPQTSKKSARPNEPRKKRRTNEEGTDATTTAAADDNEDNKTNNENATTDASVATPAQAPSQSPATATGGNGHHHGRGGWNGNGNDRRGGRGGGRGGFVPRGGGRGRGRGRGGGGGGGHDRTAPPSYSFGVAKPETPAAPPSATPSLFKKWT